MLEFTEFRKSYGSSEVLNIHSLFIKSGIFWIKGANGSGKSTLLRAIAGIIHFDGDIILNQSISLKKQAIAYRKLVNFAEAEPLFPEFLTGMEMINLFSAAKDAPKHQHTYFVESMKMNDYIHEPLGTYSSGMLKKLSLVLAFIGHPKLILLDEPLITLDSESLKTLHTWIDEKHRQENVSFLVSSHQPLTINESTSIHELLVNQQTVTCCA